MPQEQPKFTDEPGFRAQLHAKRHENLEKTYELALKTATTFNGGALGIVLIQGVFAKGSSSLDFSFAYLFVAGCIAIALSAFFQYYFIVRIIESPATYYVDIDLENNRFDMNHGGAAKWRTGSIIALAISFVCFAIGCLIGIYQLSNQMGS